MVVTQAWVYIYIYIFCVTIYAKIQIYDPSCYCYGLDMKYI